MMDKMDGLIGWTIWTIWLGCTGLMNDRDVQNERIEGMVGLAEMDGLVRLNQMVEIEELTQWSGLRG